MEPGSMRGQPQVMVGDDAIDSSSVEAVALLGWQEVAATDRIWDVMLALRERSIDVVNGHANEDEARELAKTIATALNVELRESSTTGGAVNPIRFDARGRARID